ncbi:MAG: ankyrin repeat domain-containing protein [Candidatus Micrarchaeota archaeon]|nr:ankyrin repeat domain-containing protein [Candidatus Micrarchaeota archaeon]
MAKLKNADLEAANQRLIGAAAGANVDAVKRELAMGADIDARRPESMGRTTALMSAAYYDREEIVELLIKKGASLELKDSLGSTALILAARTNSTRSLDLLLKWGSDKDARDETGMSAMMHSAYKDNIGAVRLLIRAGADPYAKSANGANASDCAGSPEMKAEIDEYMQVLKKLENGLVSKGLQLSALVRAESVDEIVRELEGN